MASAKPWFQPRLYASYQDWETMPSRCIAPTLNANNARCSSDNDLRRASVFRQTAEGLSAGQERDKAVMNFVLMLCCEFAGHRRKLGEDKYDSLTLLAEDYARYLPRNTFSIMVGPASQAQLYSPTQPYMQARPPWQIQPHPQPQRYPQAQPFVPIQSYLPAQPYLNYQPTLLALPPLQTQPTLRAPSYLPTQPYLRARSPPQAHSYIHTQPYSQAQSYPEVRPSQWVQPYVTAEPPLEVQPYSRIQPPLLAQPRQYATHIEFQGGQRIPEAQVVRRAPRECFVPFQPRPGDTITVRAEILENVGPDFKPAGYVYCASWPESLDFVKIGYSAASPIDRVARQQKCFPGVRLEACFQFRFPEKIERLIHRELCRDRHEVVSCDRCDGGHIELFKIPALEAIRVMSDWYKLERKEFLYDSRGGLRPIWRSIIEELTGDITATVLLDALRNRSARTYESTQYIDTLTQRLQQQLWL